MATHRSRSRKLKLPNRAWVLPMLLPLAVLWQSGPLAQLPVFGWRLDPTLVLSIAAGLLLGPRYGLVFGALAGGSEDLMLGAGLLYTITKAIAGWTAGLIQPHIYRLDIVTLILIGLVWTLVEGLIVALYIMAQGRAAVWDHYAALALPLSIAHAFMVAVLYGILHQFPGPESRETAERI